MKFKRNSKTYNQVTYLSLKKKIFLFIIRVTKKMILLSAVEIFN